MKKSVYVAAFAIMCIGCMMVLWIVVTVTNNSRVLQERTPIINRMNSDLAEAQDARQKIIEKESQIIEHLIWSLGSPPTRPTTQP